MTIGDFWPVAIPLVVLVAFLVYWAFDEVSGWMVERPSHKHRHRR
jgi:hypothetical protein